MPTLNNKKLLNVIRYAPILIVGCFAIAVNLMVIQHSREAADVSIENLRTELLNHQKNSVREQVYDISKQLRIEKSELEREIKEQEKARVYEAYSVAHNIYNNNVNQSKEKVTLLIAEALRPMKFFNGRGYFFVYDLNGIGVIHSLMPDIEGQPSWDMQDSHGNYVIRELIDIVEQNNEGFHWWWFQKPGQPLDLQFYKVGFVKKFEPYQWLIGTGEYILDAEQDMQQRALKWLSNYEYGEGGYFFVIDNNGTLLSHHYNGFLGADLSVGESIPGEWFEKINLAASQGGGFVQYKRPLTTSGKVSLEQISYVKRIKDWDWIIGTGFYQQAFTRELKQKEQVLIKKNDQEIARLVVLGIISTLILMAVSLYLGSLIARRFALFHQRLTLDFKRLENTKNKMKHMALHDSLTGLPNRTLLMKETRKRLHSAEESMTYLAIMFADLDNFKSVNDLYGHTVGDKLLVEVSKKFTAVLDERDLVARFGGDEFVFCFSRLTSLEEARQRADMILTALNTPFIIDGRELNIGCSVGVSVYPFDCDEAEDLVSNADIALYKSKALHKGQVLFYDSAVSEQIKHDLTIENELKQAVENGEIYLQYQPQIDVISGTIVGVEALARWNNSVLGNVPPDKFISIAEETGKIQEIGLFVFRRACEDIYRLSANGDNALCVSVNISPKQFIATCFADQIMRICDDVGIAPHRVTIEITENVFIHQLEVVVPIFERIRRYGFGLSLDDFGTGYSSLSYINALPLTELKIDRMFVDNMLDNPQTDMLVKIIIEIGQYCGMSVVAEGVETAQQYQRLAEYQCHLVQGYYYSRPLSLEKLGELYTS